MHTNDIQNLMGLNAHLLGESCLSELRRHEEFRVARTGQKIPFTLAENVPKQLSYVLEKFNSLFVGANDRASLANAMAFFWFGFSEVHPFADGNVRTAQYFLSQKAMAKGFKLTHPEELVQLPVNGSLTEDLPYLTHFFFTHLE